MQAFDLQNQRYAHWQDLRGLLHKEAPGLSRVLDHIQALESIERFWAYPGIEVLQKIHFYYNENRLHLLSHLVENVVITLEENRYRTRFFLPYFSNLSTLDKPHLQEHTFLEGGIPPFEPSPQKPYFEVLVVHPLATAYEFLYRDSLADLKSDRDEFLYDLVFVETIEDAFRALLSNPTLQSVVLLEGLKPPTTDLNSLFKGETTILQGLLAHPLLGLTEAIGYLRPELDLFLISEHLPNEVDPVYQGRFRRILSQAQPFPDLHYYILNSIRNRFSTPFFHALQAYSRRPKGVFHALPISRGQSLQNSPWVSDFITFYGPNIFLAETSSTQGGLDSLLDPKGPIKQAQNEAAKTFGSHLTYFVTNGTSTANKIVLQATLSPSDIVLIASDCHKSVFYAVMLAGATPEFIMPYTLDQYDLYGGASLREIKKRLLDYKARGQLHLVKQIVLTNSTFDGLIYNIDRYMMDILAIKPDLLFLFDEAWFAFAHFSPSYRHRSGMSVAKLLEKRFLDPHYKQTYQTWAEDFSKRAEQTPEIWETEALYPDPDQVKVRVYVTQSTHKTLTAFRQASMIHIWDHSINQDRFLEAYRIHSTTSPNYQILASLDVGRRQASLEGYERVKKMRSLALYLREQITNSPLLSCFFTVLESRHLVPIGYQTELSVDPTRITLDIRKTGMLGGNFRELLINRYDIQINKTSRYTALFIINIGSTQESIDHVLRVLHDIAQRLQENVQIPNAQEEAQISLPTLKQFHPNLQTLRHSYYMAVEQDIITHVPLDDTLLNEVQSGKKWVSAGFVTPYPPGVPMLIPGQHITYDILLYLQSIQNKEIHGYNAQLGLKVFKEAYIENLC